MTPKISIITINYNDCTGLQKTFDSVFGQTWQDFEYIVIDGGSTDGSKELIEQHQAKINYWVSEPDKGIYNAMNKGIAVATGEYLLFLNGGDHFYSNTVLEENYIDICDADIVCFDVELIGNTKKYINCLPSEISFSFMYGRTLTHQCVFIANNLFKTIGLYQEEYEIVADWVFFMKAFFHINCSYKKVNAVLTCYYFGGLSDTSPMGKIEREQVLKLNYSNLNKEREELENARQILGSNRVKMLLEIEKSRFGKKMVSLLFRLYIFCFSKRKLEDILINNKKASTN